MDANYWINVLRDAQVGNDQLSASDFGKIADCLAALRTASAEPSPEVNVEALTDEALLALWPNVRYDFSEGREDILEFGRAALAAQADARREDGAMLDARRYRWLRHADLDEMAAKYWPGQDVPEGEGFDRAIDAAMNTTKGADRG